MTNFFLISLLVHSLLSFAPFQVEGLSMYPTLRNHEVFMIDRVNFKVEGLKRGDIVVFRILDEKSIKSGEDSIGNDYFYVKRIIGLPGESLKIGADGVFIKANAASLEAEEGAEQYRKLNETYLKGHRYDYGDERFFIIPEGSYFVMGDNRQSSKDSRYFANPYISIDEVYGKYVWP